jgi:nucleolin
MRLARSVARRALPLVAARPLSVAAGPARLWGVAAAKRSAAAPVAWSAWRTCATASEEAAPAPRMERDTSTQLFVGNLSFTTEATSLGSMFTDYSVVDTKVIYDQQTGRSKGIAFVTFASADDATKAQAAMNGAMLDGRSIRVESRTPPGERKPYAPREARPMSPRRSAPNDERKLFVGNLAWAVDGLDLEDIFKEFGAVESAQVVTDRETGRSRGFGFVIMQTKAESEKAARELAGANIDGRKIVVEFASEKFKEPRPE